MASKNVDFAPSTQARHPTGFHAPAPITTFRGSLVHQDTVLETPTPKRGVSEWAAYIREGWTDVGIWRSAFIETVATGLLVFISGLIDTTIGNFGTTQGAAYAGVTNVFLLTLFIMAAGPGSGGHVNPTITFATMITGLTGFSRGILYMLGQLLGSAVAGGVLRGAFGRARSAEYHGGGCFRDPHSVSLVQAFLIEVFSVFALLFLAFGVALDPRQLKLFGKFAAPLGVGCSVGLISFASGAFATGYSGTSMHPGRCFAFAVARSDFADQWIWWVGPMVGAILHMITFKIAPPYHSIPVPEGR